MWPFGSGYHLVTKCPPRFLILSLMKSLYTCTYRSKGLCMWVMCEDPDWQGTIPPGHRQDYNKTHLRVVESVMGIKGLSGLR